MNKIRDNIWISGFDKAQDLGWLKEQGITAILNVATDVDDPDYFGKEISVVKIALGDCDYNKPYMKDLAVTTLKLMLMNNEKVLVHCAAGVSRSVWVVCKTLGDLENKNPREILEEVQQKRPIALYGPLF